MNMFFLSFITNNKLAKNSIIEIIKNIDSEIHICDQNKLLFSGNAVGYLSNLDFKNINLNKCLENAVKLSLNQDEDCEKFIFLITEEFNDNLNYNIQKHLDYEKKFNLLENFCNFYIVTSKQIEFAHPNLKIIQSLKEIDFNKLLY